MMQTELISKITNDKKDLALIYPCELHGLRFDLRYIKFYKSKFRTLKEEESLLSIWPNWFCLQSITVLSTPPSSMDTINKLLTHFYICSTS